MPSVLDGAHRGSPGILALALAALQEFLDAIRVRVEMANGVRVATPVLSGKCRAILRVIGAESSALKNCDSETHSGTYRRVPFAA